MGNGFASSPPPPFSTAVPASPVDGGGGGDEEACSSNFAAAAGASSTMAPGVTSGSLVSLLSSPPVIRALCMRARRMSMPLVHNTWLGVAKKTVEAKKSIEMGVHVCMPVDRLQHEVSFGARQGEHKQAARHNTQQLALPRTFQEKFKANSVLKITQTDAGTIRLRGDRDEEEGTLIASQRWGQNCRRKAQQW